MEDNLKNTTEFLSNLQGVILMLSLKRNFRAPLKQVLEKHPQIYQDLVHELNTTDSTLLKGIIRNEKNLPSKLVEESKIKILKGLGYTEEQIFNLLNADKETKLNLPTEFQNEDSYKMINGLKEEILSSIQSTKYSINELPIFATTQTFNFNACAILPKNSDIPIILFEDDLFTYCYLLSKILISAIPLHEGKIDIDHGPVDKHLNNNEWISDKFGEYLYYNTVPESISMVERFDFLDLESKKYVDSIIGGIELFILGHEFGHIVDNHLTNTKNRSPQAFDAGSIINPDWEKEFKADEIGLELALAALEKNGVPLSLQFWGIESLLTFWHILDMAHSMLNNKDAICYKITSSHPPPIQRKERLRKKFYELTKDELALKISNNASQILFELWNRTKEKYLENVRNL